jgi:hypothetical protein
MTTINKLHTRIKESLNQDYKSGKIEFLDLMSILYILSQAKDSTELLALMEIYRQDYSALDYILTQEVAAQADAEQKDIQLIVSAFVKENPKQANNLFKFLENNKNATIQDLLVEFPQIKKYSK